ncbi:hypothetical protein BS78_06G271800 [Paspalum vaginatum]|nr:hypothetical protein BS78_06G271800 [Paspalum vaginatum]
MAAERGSSAGPLADASKTKTSADPGHTPPRLRLLPFPKTSDVNDVHKWNKEWKRVSPIIAKDPRLKLLTQRKPNDSDRVLRLATVYTTNTLLSSTVRCAARSIVNITSTMHVLMDHDCDLH